jgi:hypothetical protein
MKSWAKAALQASCMSSNCSVLGALTYFVPTSLYVTFLNTVLLNKIGSYYTSLILFRSYWMFSWLISILSSVMLPEVGLYYRSNMVIIVLLPDSEVLTRAVVLPAGKFKSSRLFGTVATS